MTTFCKTLKNKPKNRPLSLPLAAGSFEETGLMGESREKNSWRGAPAIFLPIADYAGLSFSQRDAYGTTGKI